MTQEMLEVLIGKFLDSEITPGERRLLNEEFEQNAESRRLFEAFERMHVQSRAVVGTAVHSGQSVQHVFERAWEQSRGRLARHRLAGWRRFGAGLAAGLIIGAGAVTCMLRGVEDVIVDPGAIVNADSESESTADVPVGWDAPNAVTDDVIRQVDLYNFTDDSGGRWLVEGLRETRIQPAIYYQDL